MKEPFCTSASDLLTFLEPADQAVLWVRQEGVITFANRAARALLGIPPLNTVSFPPFAALVLHQTTQSLLLDIEKAATDPHATIPITFVHTQNQTAIPAQVQIRPLTAPNHKDSTYWLTICPQSGSKKGFTDLWKNPNTLQAIIERAPNGIIIVDDAGYINYLNLAAAALFDYEVNELLSASIVQLMPPSIAVVFEQYLLQNTIAPFFEAATAQDVKGRKKSGALFPFRLMVSQLDLDNHTYYAGIIEDLTERKKYENKLLWEKERYQSLNAELENRMRQRSEELAETINKLLAENADRRLAESMLRNSQEELEKALQKERELGELKSRFVSMASHEFRTPLSSILSSASLIGRYNTEATTEKRTKHVNRIKSNVKTLTGILHDFLSAARLEEGKLQNQPVSFNVPSFANDLLEQLEGYHENSKNINYRHEGTDETVVLDQKLLKNVCTNLLSNAMKYSASNQVINFVTKRTDTALRIEVTDQGIGIPKNEQPHLFERFFRAHNAVNIKGTGLGLSLVKQYVELMDGKIDFRSEEGVGTSFFISFRC